MSRRSKDKPPLRNRAANIVAQEHRYRALELRKAGWTFRAIAANLHMSVSSVHEAISTGIAELRDVVGEQAVAVRTLELARLDSILKAHWKHRGKPAHAMILLRTQQRRADLLGLDAPKNLQIGGVAGGPLEVHVKVVREGKRTTAS